MHEWAPVNKIVRLFGILQCPVSERIAREVHHDQLCDFSIAALVRERILALQQRLAYEVKGILRSYA